MASKNTRYTFVIAAPLAERLFQAFLDMLRYDAATVIEGSSSMIVLQCVGHEPTRARWASFGMYVLAEQTGDYPSINVLKDEASHKLPL